MVQKSVAFTRNFQEQFPKVVTRVVFLVITFTGGRGKGTVISPVCLSVSTT